MIGIYGPNGHLISDSIRPTRDIARNDFAKEHDTKWQYLWLLGYKVRAIKRGG
jgi:hypothetical protein